MSVVPKEPDIILADVISETEGWSIELGNMSKESLNSGNLEVCTSPNMIDHQVSIFEDDNVDKLEEVTEVLENYRKYTILPRSIREVPQKRYSLDHKSSRP